LSPEGVGTLPVYIGTAPVNQLNDFSGAINTPLLVSSYEEAKALSGYDDPEKIARFFIARGVENVVIKLGEEGCYVMSPGEDAAFYAPSYRLNHVVDTSGAGDAFCAGFITGLLSGFSIRQCARFANAVAAHCIMEIGTTRGVKDRETILRFMNENR
ncbi:MAG: carbohydrate kinase family protein, partial [Atribacterota bacterium]|nr:carbohydrate kinase family protein [Atribacterota bacterium]